MTSLRSPFIGMGTSPAPAEPELLAESESFEEPGYRLEPAYELPDDVPRPAPDRETPGTGPRFVEEAAEPVAEADRPTDLLGVTELEDGTQDWVGFEEEWEDPLGGELLLGEDPLLGEDGEWSTGGLATLTEQQVPVVAPSCRPLTQASVVPAIGFELDLSYGASTVRPPVDPTGLTPAWEASVAALEGENVTTHRMAADGFRLEGDGNRIEIATRAFTLDDAGRQDLRQVMRAVVGLVDEMAKACAKARPDRTLGFPRTAGAPRHFVLPTLEPRAACFFPLRFDPRNPYFRDGCSVAAAPQATLTLPLSRIDELVTAIRASERQRVAGLAMSGPRDDRLGDRSDALYDAQRAVNADRTRHLRAGTDVPGVGPVTAATYSKSLQGLLILMVSYLRAGELTYGPKDWEAFAKAYLPLNVKNPFRLPYADLGDAEKKTFRALYDGPGGRVALWRLARSGADATAGTTTLFPATVWGHQGGWFAPPPTWDDLVTKTVHNTPLLRTEAGPKKKGEDVGCEVLYAPLSRLLPYQPGSLRVTVEMRRLGFNWVFAHANGERPGWATMTSRLFDLARTLNS